MGIEAVNILKESNLRIMLVTTTLAGMEGFMSGLINSGAEVTHARNGMTAIEMMKTRSPALVVVDSGLSDFNPLELAAELRRVNPMVTTMVMGGIRPNHHKRSHKLNITAKIANRPDLEQARFVMMALKRFSRKHFGPVDPASHRKDAAPTSNASTANPMFVLT